MENQQSRRSIRRSRDADQPADGRWLTLDGASQSQQTAAERNLTARLRIHCNGSFMADTLMKFCHDFDDED